MKTLLSLLLALSVGLPSAAAEMVYGRVISDFKVKNVKVSTKKARFMIKSILDASLIEGMEGIVSLVLDEEFLDMKFRVFRSKELGSSTALFNLSNWGIDEVFAPKKAQLEVSRKIELVKIEHVELFKAKTKLRRKAGKVAITSAGPASAYYCRLRIKGERDFMMRASSKKYVWRLAVAFSSLLDIPIERDSEINPVGVRIADDVPMVIEVNTDSQIRGLELFSVVTGIDGQKVIQGDDITEMLGSLDAGSHKLKIISPRGQKKRSANIDVGF